MKKMFLVVVVTIVATLSARSYFSREAPVVQTEVVVKHPQNIFFQRLEPQKKINVKEVLMNDIKGKAELITLEIELQQTLEWDETWWEKDVFRKSQKVTFHGSGIYTTDLAEIDYEDVMLDEGSKRILIKMNRPSVRLVNLNEEKTEFNDVETGVLRFGNVKMTPEESEILRKVAKDKMNEELNSEENLARASLHAESAINELFSKVLDSIDQGTYEIEVSWKS